MKRIFPLALVLAALVAGGLACKKADQPGFMEDSGNQTTQNAASPQAAESKDKLLKELTAVLQQYFASLDRGDKAALERLLSVDFNTRWQGKDYDKDGWITPQQGQPNVASNEVFNAQLEGSSADTATVHFERRLTYKDGSPPYKVRDSATLVKRDGRWQLKTLIPGH
ncbi:MAG TPA: nuclear transport factor 2 family protein [Pyrinomonadaceae bacterium]|nr:nuclear transport factor 2 family protein [Pyrinomonadaceae bacterium]